MYATVVGSYHVRIPIAALAIPATVEFTALGYSIAPGMGLGVIAIYLALLGDFYDKAAINTGRFWSGRWQAVVRRAGVGAD